MTRQVPVRRLVGLLLLAACLLLGREQLVEPLEVLGRLTSQRQRLRGVSNPVQQRPRLRRLGRRLFEGLGFSVWD